MDHRGKPGGDSAAFVIAGLDPAIHKIGDYRWVNFNSIRRLRSNAASLLPLSSG